MFISKEHHPQLLDPSCYHGRSQFDDEIAQLFLPAWHCVGLTDELPNDGSYRTFELLGNPVVLWRKGGQIRAYLNVCSHRQCIVAAAACGSSDRLKCGYHGWEYDES